MSTIHRSLSVRSGAAIASATLAAGALAVSAVACNDGTSPRAPRIAYGAPVAVGNGHARTYVTDNPSDGGAPLEIGVALDEAALDGLPAPMSMPGGSGDPHAHADYHEYLLPLPTQNPTPYRLVELDWNPGGHEPPGIYDVPHFDFHFYTNTKADRDAIDPAMGDAEYGARSAALPPEAQRAPNYVPLAAPGAPIVAVPHMGVHWSDVRSPELQGALGHPENYKPFTTTFIHGSWNGQFIFDEPMVTRAFILGRKGAATAAQRDSVMALPLPARTPPGGVTPAAYRVTWDADAKEYHIALTQLVRQP
jgi:hypothetical protein